MKRDKEVARWKTVSAVLLILIIGLVVYSVYQCLEDEEYSEGINDKAMLDVEVRDWGANEDIPGELLFNYWITNYGDLKAKDIEVTCKLSDSLDKVSFSSTDSYGDLAPRSSELGEFTTEKTTSVKYNEVYSAYCYIESCSDCEILHKRVQDLVESYEGS